jgi:collagenase-like PrtC family protease
MSIGERINELNARLFALEGRMRAFEELSEQDRAYRQEVHARLIKGQEILEDRVRRMDNKLAWYAGCLAALGLILKLLVK